MMTDEDRGRSANVSSTEVSSTSFAISQLSSHVRVLVALLQRRLVLGGSLPRQMLLLSPERRLQDVELDPQLI
jgi:hypothetical protein